MSHSPAIFFSLLGMQRPDVSTLWPPPSCTCLKNLHRKVSSYPILPWNHLNVLPLKTSGSPPSSLTMSELLILYSRLSALCREKHFDHLIITTPYDWWTSERKSTWLLYSFQLSITTHWKCLSPQANAESHLGLDFFIVVCWCPVWWLQTTTPWISKEQSQLWQCRNGSAASQVGWTVWGGAVCPLLDLFDGCICNLTLTLASTKLIKKSQCRWSCVPKFRVMWALKWGQVTQRMNMRF